MARERLPRGPARLALALLASALTVFAVRAATGAGGWLGELVVQWGAPVVMLGAAAICAWRAVAVRPERGVWAFVGAALACSGLGNVALPVLYGSARDAPTPSAGDVFWTGFFPLMYVGLVLLLRRHAQRRGAGLWLDGLIGALGCGALGAALVLDTFQQAAAGKPLATALTTLVYPVGDLTLLAMLVGAAILIGRRHGAGLRLLAAGVAVYAVTDVVHLLAILDGSYEIGTLLDAGWLAGGVLMAAAATAPPTPRAAAPRSGRRGAGGRAIPVLSATAALAVLTLQPLVRYDTVGLSLAVAALALTIARMSVSLRENDDLLGLREREAVTDALTGLGNRRRLVADLDRAATGATADRPRLLVLFDLDGFKAYNDTFGHAAGDTLLTRIGTTLAAAVGERGRAYRMGGDEFCALLDPRGEQPAVVAAALAAALHEQGPGFDVSASHGAAALPRDGAEGAALLRVADDAMYARKASRRPGAERQVEDALLAALRERRLGERGRAAGELAVAVAGRLGVSATELRALEHAAALHDVGKLAIPDAILDKAGPLDDDERAFVRTHPLIAQRIISAAPALRYAAQLVRSCRERWDGQGYPDGLRGEAIPLSSRIVAVCSAYDAITGERPHRATRSPQTALDELRRCAGSQFDPAVVQALAEVVAERARASGAHASAAHSSSHTRSG